MQTGRMLSRSAAALAVVAVLALASAASANDPLGACCSANGSCEDLQAVQCTGAGQTFIGEGTSCASVDCARPHAVPALSIFGAVAAIGALAALGIRRLVAGRQAT